VIARIWSAVSASAGQPAKAGDARDADSVPLGAQRIAQQTAETSRPFRTRGVHDLAEGGRSSAFSVELPAMMPIRDHDSGLHEPSMK